MRAARRASRAAGAVLLLTACSAEAAPDGATAECRIDQRPATLPAGLEESSGAALSVRTPGVVWTHNDSGGDADLYAVRPTGELVGRVRVEGADNRDWEDIAVGPCPEGSCVYIADTGDNDGKRKDVDIYRVAEPDPGAGRTAKAERFRIRYPGGPRDAEALFVLPGGELFVVSKGRREAVQVFRYPGALRAGEPVEMEPVATLHPTARDVVLQVTAADASPDGRWVAIRAYGSLMIFRAAELTRGEVVPVRVVDLAPLAEAQGEGVAMTDDGRVLLTSEGDGGAPATVSILTCELPG